jgi:MFS family permease
MIGRPSGLSLVSDRRATHRPLDWLNFLLADVQGGLGPFLAIYLTASRHWDPGSAGLMLTIAGLATVAASPALGGLVDRVRWKRAIVVAGAAAVALAAMTEAILPQPWPVGVAQLGSGIADAAFPPAIAALSLGLVGRAAYTARVGRNQAYNHSGNVVTAALSGVAGWLIAPVAVLWAVTLFSTASIAAVLLIEPGAIDHGVARGADDGRGREDGAVSGMRSLFACRPLLLFTLSITLFHLANAAMLPLAGERLSSGGDGGTGAVWMAACIVLAQLVMIPASLLVGHRADRWGRKLLFLVGFGALPVRAACSSPWSARLAGCSRSRCWMAWAPASSARCFRSWWRTSPAAPVGTIWRSAPLRRAGGSAPRSAMASPARSWTGSGSPPPSWC